MTYELGFLDSALKEWARLDGAIREQFKKKLAERLEHPRVVSAGLSGQRDRYKIKLRNAGYRLVYEVRDAELIILVIAVGRRDRNAVYEAARTRRDGWARTGFRKSSGCMQRACRVGEAQRTHQRRQEWVKRRV